MVVVVVATTVVVVTGELVVVSETAVVSGTAAEPEHANKTNRTMQLRRKASTIPTARPNPIDVAHLLMVCH
jgi:hypothetical protein